MTRFLMCLTIVCMGLPIVGCGGGPSASPKPEQEVIDSTADPSKLATPAEISPEAPGGGTAPTP